MDKAAASEALGREIRVFLRAAAIQSSRQSTPQSEDAAGFYNFTADDYARVMAHKKEDKVLKTRKHREAEIQARRARITKATVRVQFPDHLVLEAKFSSKDTVAELVQLVKKALHSPDAPFYLYTAPPKQVLRNLAATMYEAGLAPGGLVYFSYVKDANEAPFLRSDIAALLEEQDTSPKPPAPVEDAPQQQEELPAPPKMPSPANPSKSVPKWFKVGK